MEVHDVDFLFRNSEVAIKLQFLSFLSGDFSAASSALTIYEDLEIDLEYAQIERPTAIVE